MTMLGMSGTAFSESTMKTLISRALHIVVHVSRMQDGKRRVTGISEMLPGAPGEIHMQEVFAFERSGMTSDGSIVGRHVQKTQTAMTPRFRAAGLDRGATAGEVG